MATKSEVARPKSPGGRPTRQAAKNNMVVRAGDVYPQSRRRGLAGASKQTHGIRARPVVPDAAQRALAGRAHPAATSSVN